MPKKIWYNTYKSKISFQEKINKNTKCPTDAHCHRHCRRDPRITKDCIEFLQVLSFWVGKKFLRKLRNFLPKSRKTQKLPLTSHDPPQTSHELPFTSHDLPWFLSDPSLGPDVTNKQTPSETFCRLNFGSNAMQLMTKFWTNPSCATWGPNLQLMQVVVPGECKWQNLQLIHVVTCGCQF